MEHEYLTPGIVLETLLLRELLDERPDGSSPRRLRRRRRAVPPPAVADEAEAIQQAWPAPKAVDPEPA